MPRYKLLAIVTNIPVIKEIATFTYDKILAPILYKSHLRRQAKKAKQSTTKPPKNEPKSHSIDTDETGGFGSEFDPADWV